MKLYSWGANSHGQLGQDIMSEACCSPAEVGRSCVDTVSILSIVGGGGHSLLLDDSGKVYSCGWNHRGQLGHKHNKTATFHVVDSISHHHINQVACGWDSSLAVSAEGSLLVFGANNYCQLGIPKQKLKSVTSPISLSTARVKQAALGLRHLMLVTEDGKVFASGCGSKGQLGIVDPTGDPYQEVETVTQVPHLDNIVQVSCGQNHSLALSETGKIFVWGDNRFGQLGFDPATQPVVYRPQELPLSNVQDMKGNPSSMFAGWTHSVVVTDRNELVNWGRNTYGQLACGEREDIVWNPAVLNVKETINQVSVGSEHTLVLTSTGHILSWGWNEHGNCGTGSQENIHKPSRVNMPEKGRAILIGAGAGHSFALFDASCGGSGQ